MTVETAVHHLDSDAGKSRQRVDGTDACESALNSPGCPTPPHQLIVDKVTSPLADLPELRAAAARTHELQRSVRQLVDRSADDACGVTRRQIDQLAAPRRPAALRAWHLARVWLSLRHEPHATQVDVIDEARQQIGLSWAEVGQLAPLSTAVLGQKKGGFTDAGISPQAAHRKWSRVT